MAPRVSFDPAREEDELRQYLGSAYRREDLENYQELLDAEAASIDDEAELYRTSHAYLYNLTAFAMSGTKLPYLEMLVRNLPPGARLLDYGCGIGSDGLMLLDAGYEVEFADFANPSSDFLRWRLEHRALQAPVHDLDAEVPGDFDGAFAFDVIEHVLDPNAFLGEMERRARLVEVNLLEFDAHEQELHHRLPIRNILLRAARLTLLEYAICYGTSHVVLYGTEPVSVPRRTRNIAAIATVVARRRCLDAAARIRARSVAAARQGLRGGHRDARL